MKLLVFIFLLFYSIIPTNAQTSIKEIINNMPEDMMPYINNDQMAELLEFTDKKDSVKIKNVFNGTSSIDSLSLNFAKISLSKATELQLKLLPAGDTTQIVCVVKTIKKPLRESTVKFYSTDWKSLNSEFGLPEKFDTDSILNMFVQRPDTMSEVKFKELCNYFEPVMLTANFENNDNIITFSLSLPFVQKDTYKELNAILKKISFKWDGQKLKKC